MKKRYIIAAAVLLAAGCTNKEKLAETTANGFLEAYLANEYEKAAEFCNEELGSKFMEATADFSSLDPSVRELIVAECEKYGAEVTGVMQVNKSDTVEVQYQIYKKADSLSFERGKVTGYLKIVGGKITKLGQ